MALNSSLVGGFDMSVSKKIGVVQRAAFVGVGVLYPKMTSNILVK